MCAGLCYQLFVMPWNLWLYDDRTHLDLPYESSIAMSLSNGSWWCWLRQAMNAISDSHTFQEVIFTKSGLDYKSPHLILLSGGQSGWIFTVFQCSNEVLALPYMLKLMQGATWRMAVDNLAKGLKLRLKVDELTGSCCNVIKPPRLCYRLLVMSWIYITHCNVIWWLCTFWSGVRVFNGRVFAGCSCRCQHR